MKNIKRIIFLIVCFLCMNNAYAGDFNQNSETVFDVTGSDVNSSVMIPGVSGFPLFGKDSTKVIHTSGKPWMFKFGKKKKDISADEGEILPVTNYETTDEQEAKPQTTVTSKSNVNKKKKNKDDSKTAAFSNSSINIYCDNMDYIQDTKEVVGTGNAKVLFVENNSMMTADKITYNHDMNYIEGIDNVKMIKNGNVMEGDYAKLDLNYGNVLMDKPIMSNGLVRIVAKNGNITADSLDAYDGIAETQSDMERRVSSMHHGGFFPMDVSDDLNRKFYPKEYKNRKAKYHIKTKEMYVDSTDGHDVITFKNADIYWGKVLLMKGAYLSMSTDKTQSYIETTFPEMGSMRHLGAYFGPGVVLNTPLSSTLKIAPLLVLDNGKFGIGGMARFAHRRNFTEVFYGSSRNEFIGRGIQKLGDSGFSLEYAKSAYMNDWLTGSNISQYLIQLAYGRGYLFPELGLSMQHRAVAGYITDEYNTMGTTRFKYQGQLSKDLFSYKNLDKKFLATLSLVAQGQMGVYGTGDTTGVFRVGPSLRTQYKGWSQYLIYFQSAKGGSSPLIYTDDYRYGGATLQLTESLRLNKYISIGALIVLNLTNNDITTSNMFSETRLMVSLGPEDAKFSFGYDIYRQGATFNYTALVGAKNQDIKFKKYHMKDPDKFGKEKNKKAPNKLFHIFDYSDIDETNRQEINTPFMFEMGRPL